MAEQQRAPTPRRVATVISSMVLVGVFVWYRAHRAGAEKAVFVGTKSAAVHRPDAPAESQPATTQAGGNLVVLPDSKAFRLITPGDLTLSSTAAPTTRDLARIYGSKSAPIVEVEDLLSPLRDAAATQLATTAPAVPQTTQPTAEP